MPITNRIIRNPAEGIENSVATARISYIPTLVSQLLSNFGSYYAQKNRPRKRY